MIFVAALVAIAAGWVGEWMDGAMVRGGQSHEQVQLRLHSASQQEQQ